MCGEGFARYGGATTCVLAHMGGQFIALDAGTGIMNLPGEVTAQKELPLLLTHAHADHLLGLPMCDYVMRLGARLDVYGARRGGLDAREQVERLVAPPLWPIKADGFLTEICFHDLPESMTLGAVRVDAMDGVHPGGVSVFRLEAGDRSVVFASDCTVTDELRPKLIEFARGCDLLLIDGQYGDEEWPTRRAYGHSTWTMAAKLAEACGAKRLRVTHHDPRHTDAMLAAWDETLRGRDPAYAFAREGETIEL